MMEWLIILVPLVLAGVVWNIREMSAMQASLVEIKDNHLKHIYERLQSIDEFLRKQF